VSKVVSPNAPVALKVENLGKSTFLRCINLLETPTSGTVTVSGETIRMAKNSKGEAYPTDKKQVSRIRSELGMVFQSFNLWSHKTILENIIEAPIYVQGRSRAECVEEAEALLAKVGIADKRDFYPAHLSGGQQQRAAIARALAMKPKVMLFDEPTSALDPEMVGEVLDVIQSLARTGVTMLVVTHEMSFARRISDRIIFMEKGEIIEQNAPDAFFDNPQTERARFFLNSIVHA